MNQLRYLSCACLAAAAAATSGCKNVPMLPGISPYSVEIQQGNVVTQDMVAKLKPGMTRQQVRFVMGTPPIADIFHSDRWDYVYYVNKRGQIVEHRRLVLLFDGEVLKRVEGDVVAAPGAAAAPEKRGPSVPAGAQAAEKPPAEERAVSQPSDKPAVP